MRTPAAGPLRHAETEMTHRRRGGSIDTAETASGYFAPCVGVARGHPHDARRGIVKRSRTVRMLAIIGSAVIVGGGLFTGAQAVGAVLRTPRSSPGTSDANARARLHQTIAHLP